MKSKLFLLLVLCGLGLPTVCGAQNTTLRVTLDTHLLPSRPVFDPYILDFQLNDGGGSLADVNTAVVQNFSFGGGERFYVVDSSGNVAFDFQGNATLRDDVSSFNQFRLAFQPGDFLYFETVLTGAVDPTDLPDEFSFGLGTFSEPIPTLGPAEALLTVDIDGVPPTIAAYGADPSRTDIQLPAPTVQAVPEPGATALLPLLCVGWLALRRRRL